MKELHNRTKIVATLGPASASKEVLLQMINAGLNVCRINFSHGKHAEHQTTINTIREINKEYNYNVGILADLQGPKIRIGDMENNGVYFNAGDTVKIITTPKLGDKDSIYITYEPFPKDVNPGEIFLLDDGKMQMRVLATNRVDEVQAEVIYGGTLSSKKGVNLPYTKTSTPSLTEKDREDLEFALKNDLDWIGLSFVREAKDIIELKKIIADNGKISKVIAKIEKPEAIENIDSIIDVTDGVMVARGDLGVEMPMEEVPLLQKQIVKKCNALAKPVIIATQMMDSMVNNPRPTRAEANDVANSVLDGADAVMLSNETSVGDYPVIVIESMSKIIRNIENSMYPYYNEHHIEGTPERFLADSVCNSAVFLAEKTNAKAIVAMSFSGYSAYQIAGQRPKAHTYVFTGNRDLLNSISLVWGVRAYYYDKFETTDKTIQEVNDFLKENNFVQTGEIVINTASTPIIEKGRTNTVKVSVIS
ncbi:pyruvate kinase [Solitalea koreensis]|uniref:Pyruvate kinase n=1 Tax=Solitalea koreensis TaxID=543615 RepID=A0A521AZ80_9SPHI|nr:pyruvate kinase [Solitalea koreensis]SMO39820.1 pyruvate kinase [Solitalea koreensis]